VWNEQLKAEGELVLQSKISNIMQHQRSQIQQEKTAQSKILIIIPVSMLNKWHNYKIKNKR